LVQVHFSEERIASIFNVEEQGKTRMQQVNTDITLSLWGKQWEKKPM
jgi:hypothetical protein